MKTRRIAGVFVAALVVFTAGVACGDDGGRISITLTDVDMSDVVLMFTKITGMNITYDPALLAGKRATVSLSDQPWRPALSGILAKHGLTLAEGDEAGKLYSIVPARKSGQLSQLSGKLKRTEKALSPYVLQLDGGGSVYLRGESLKAVPEGARIWVSGAMKTQLHGAGGQVTDRTAAQPRQWHVFMVVEEWKKISKAFEVPAN